MIKIGVIGLGNMGKLHVMNALHIDGVNVVAAADKIDRNRKSVEKYHVKTYDDYTTMIDAEKLDAVIISLPNFLKKDAVDYAAENNLSIFLDKPMARNLVEAKEIVAKVKKENVRLLVGVNYRYYPCVEDLKKSFDSGKIGDPVIAEADLILNGPLSHGVVPVPVPEWWLNKETAGGGALLDLGYHLIDLLTWMLGDMDVAYSDLRYTLHLPVEDASTVVLKSKSKDITCIVNAGWFSRSSFPDFNFRVNIHGTAGYDSTDHYSPGDLRIHAVKEGMRNISRRILRQKTQYLTYTYYYSSFYKILNLFCDSLIHDIEMPVDLIKELDIIRIIDTIYKTQQVN